MFKKYLDYAGQIFFRPIHFYGKMPLGEVKDEPVNFCNITAAILAFFLSLVVFINQLLPIGITIFAGVKGLKIILLFPVMIVFGFMFFFIIFSIVCMVIVIAFLILFFLLGYLIYLGSKILGGAGDLAHSFKSSLYSSAISLIMIIPILTILLSKRGIMDFTNFKIGYNIVYSIFVLFLYGEFAIVSRKIHKVSKWKAFTAALLPTILLLIVGLAISLILIEKIQNFVV